MHFSAAFTAIIATWAATVAAAPAKSSGSATHSASSSGSSSAPSGGSKASSWAYNNFNGENDKSWKAQWNVNQWAYPQPGAKSDSNQNLNLVPNPTNSSEQVMKIAYPAGSWNPADSNTIGGVGFYATPIEIPSSADQITFTYDAYFPKGFDFNKGGKLMGLYGGHSDCSGGNSAASCFSTRFMWRSSGAGEVYAYLDKDKQVDNFCTESGVICNDDYGDSLGRGSFNWGTGQWNTVTQIVKLNTPGKQDGTLEVSHNGKDIISMKNLYYRDAKFATTGIDFETFFGGSTSDWASPKDQYAYFKGFKLSWE
ncbi:hypothetical protein INT43_001684 [Umbelopsis isabellina]|uniref:Polysaccharide lyase 14 domain-containing protein n=1 Tax=Mortierella isabellina TaxID=91625 RepID=A0A8H7UGB1_MORIS|nr:hypothetical protein INT43_001684 [Umbelopsis isabellina]